MKVRDLVKEFRDQCQARIASRNFSPADFENSMAKKKIELMLNFVHNRHSCVLE